MVDIPKFAAVVTAGTAKNTLIKIRKKIAEEAGDEDEPEASEEGKSKRPAAKGKGKKPVKEAEEDAEVEASK
jgi:hypothetical protein